MAQIDEIHIIRNRTLFNIGGKFGKEARRQFITRKDRDIDVAVLKNRITRTGPE